VSCEGGAVSAVGAASTPAAAAAAAAVGAAAAAAAAAVLATARTTSPAGIVVAGELTLLVSVLLTGACLATLLGDTSLLFVGHPGEAAIRGATAALTASISLVSLPAHDEHLL
jgi:hypothetical protein